MLLDREQGACQRASEMRLGWVQWRPMGTDHALDKLKQLCARLRAPDGCPWDRQQTLSSLQAYIVEEAYEVVDAIASEDPESLKEELGDLLFQVIFVAQIAEERGWFSLLQVLEGIYAKMVARHPHVFGAATVRSADEVVEQWERLKKKERKASVLEGVPGNLPALLKALRITEKAAAIGFDWEKPKDVLAKVREEVEELAAIVDRVQGQPDELGLQGELGDILFAIANLARHLRIDPEAACQAANHKFMRRFAAMEALASARGLALEALSQDEMESLWEEVKAARPAR